MSDTLLLAPSILSADMARFEQSMAEVANEVDYFHCDVMDGHFVPNLTFGAPVIKSLKKCAGRPLDIHLMIENPAKWVGDYLEAGLKHDDFLTFHIEAEPNPGEALARIRDAGVKAGLVIKPKTDPRVLLSYFDWVDQILVMTVEPGFGGQKFMTDMLDKVRYLKGILPENVVLAVDGGIDARTAPEAFEAGARLLVAGNAIFGKSDPSQAARDIRNAIKAKYFDYQDSMIK